MISPFDKYLGTELAPELLAIIPPDAPLSPRSAVHLKHRGKVPGSYNSMTGTWAGRKDWTKALATSETIREWSKYPDSNIGLRTKYFPGIDIDIDLPSLVQDLLPIAEQHLGTSPVRGRDGSPRLMILYRLADGAEPISSYCLKFTLPATGSTEHAIEILGNGHSVVLEGRHPKGGQYNWRNGIGPVDWGPQNLAPVTTERLQGFVAALKEKLDAIGATIISGKSGVVGSSANGGERRAIGDLGLMANVDMLEKALNLIPCEEIRDRSEWLKLMIAAKAGSGGDEEFFENVVLPWSLRYEANTEDYVRKTWASISEAELGPEYLFRIARQHEPSFFDDILEMCADLRSPNASGDLASADIPESAARGGEYRGPVPKLMPANFDPRNLPPRPFVLGYRFMTGAVTLGVAPPGTGKSNFSILTALSIATGQALTGEPVHRAGRVWIHNNEDSLEELYRRIAGVLNYHRIEFASVRENIFVTSGLDERLIVAVKEKDIVKQTAAVADVIGSIQEHKIIHIVFDPLVSTHRGVSENSNEEIEQVAEAIGYIAHATRSSIDLVHHSLKGQSRDPEIHASNMNAARGASALVGAVRIMYTLARMNNETAKQMKVPPQQAARLVRLDHGKGNYSARDPSRYWFELVTVPIGNGAESAFGSMVGGDTVAVPVSWRPTPLDGDEAQDDPKQVDIKAEKRQRVLNFVANAMQANRVELSNLIEQVEREFGIAKTTARNRLMKAIPDDCGAVAQADGVSYRLTIEREKPSPPNRIFVVRAVIGGEDGGSAGRRVGVMASGAATVKRETIVDGVDAPASLVPA